MLYEALGQVLRWTTCPYFCAAQEENLAFSGHSFFKVLFSFPQVWYYQLLHIQAGQQVNKCRWTSSKINTTDVFWICCCGGGFFCFVLLWKHLHFSSFSSYSWTDRCTHRHMQLMPIDSKFYWAKQREGEVMLVAITCHLKVFGKAKH